MVNVGFWSRSMGWSYNQRWEVAIRGLWHRHDITWQVSYGGLGECRN